MHKITKTLQTQIDPSDALATITPIFMSSAFEAGSPYFYSRKNNPNVAELEQAVATLEGAQNCIGLPTGMAAINLALSLLPVGGHLVVNRLIYGCSYKLFQRFCESREITLTTLDLTVKAEIDQIPPNADMVLFETPTNPYLKTIDIAEVSEACKSKNKNCLVVVDNTWATSLFQRPLERGADISLQSATKFICGHSDVMGGLLLTTDSAIDASLREERFYSGSVLDPHSAWMLRRSLQTMPLRMAEHVRVSLEMIKFLETRQEVEEIFWPNVDGEQLVDYGGILFFRLAEAVKDQYSAFASTLKCFKTGTGMAAVTSMVAQPFSGSHASMSEQEKADMGLGPDLVRLCFGLEHPEDLINDLTNAFSSLQEAQ
jgi:cystathionine beta-lyase/cystathionine gamma-synthase